MNLFCRQCGRKNEEDAGFCESCGAPLKGPAVAPTAAPPPQKIWSKRGLVVIVALILVIAGGLAAALLVPSSPFPAMLAKLGIRLPTGGSTGDMLYYVGQTGKWGYVDKHGTTVIPLQFDAPPNFYGNQKRDMAKSGPPYPVFQAGKWVLVNKRGKRLGEIVFDELVPGEGPLVCGSKLKKWGCVDAQGVEVIPFTFDGGYPVKENLVALMTKDLWGVVDQKGAFVIQPTFRAIRAFSDGLALVQFSDQKWGLINREGKEVSKKRFDDAASPGEGLWPVKIGDTWALADLSGEII